MKNASTTELAAAAARIAAGETRKAVQADTGLNYSQLWLYTRRQEVQGTSLDLAQVTTAATGGDAQAMSDLMMKIRVLRQPTFNRALNGELTEVKGVSWGEIAVRCNLPESRVRSLFLQQTGIKSEGQRIGKGGRYVTDDPALYQGNLRITGLAIPNETKRCDYRSLIVDLEDAITAKDAAKIKAAITKLRKQITAMRDGNGRTEEEAATFNAKADELQEKLDGLIAKLAGSKVS